MNFVFVLGAYEYLESAYSFMLKYSKITVWWHNFLLFFWFSSSADFPYPAPFRNFPGFPPSAADRSSAVAAAVGMLPSMGQPASLAALRNSSAAAALGLHQVSMMDQVMKH